MFSSENEASIPASDSLFDFIKRKVEERQDLGEGDRELVCQMAEMWGAYVGDPVTRQSLRFAWMEGCCGGGESSSYFLGFWIVIDIWGMQKEKRS